MLVSIIWAMTRNRVIGRDNKLPWRLPDEMAFFKRTTMGKPIIMGRKTYETIGRPLPGRTNIVVSRAGFEAAGVNTVRTLDEALTCAERQCARDGVDECFVAGGAAIYALALPRAHRLYFTLVDADIDGDTFFPDIDLAQWREVAIEDHPADARHPHPFSIRIMQRVEK